MAYVITPHDQERVQNLVQAFLQRKYAGIRYMERNAEKIAHDAVAVCLAELRFTVKED